MVIANAQTPMSAMYRPQTSYAYLYNNHLTSQFFKIIKINQLNQLILIIRPDSSLSFVFMLWCIQTNVNWIDKDHSVENGFVFFKWAILYILHTINTKAV
jgi:hypothetical protein